MYKKNTRYEVLTPTGFKDFSGITQNTKELRRVFVGDKAMWSSDDHQFRVNGEYCQLRDIDSGTTIDGDCGPCVLTKTETVKIQSAYDLVEVDGHEYIANTIITHNCDEFAFVPTPIQEKFWTAMRPVLSTGGQCIIASTPNGDMNLFAQLWRGAECDTNGFNSIRVKWTDPPGRDEAFKNQMIQQIGQDKWAQEYQCEFLSSDALLINSIVLARMTEIVNQSDRPSVIGGVNFWGDINKTQNQTLLVGVDPSEGTGNDYSVIEIFEFPSLRQVGEYRSNTMAPADLYSMLKLVLKHLEQYANTIYYTVENNGVGQGVISLIQTDEHPPKKADLLSEQGTRYGKSQYGMKTTKSTKIKSCVAMKSMIESGRLDISSKQLLAELKSFVRMGGSYAAQPGSTDDCVMAMTLIIRMVEEMSDYDQQAYDMLYNVKESWESLDHLHRQEFSDSLESDDDPMPITF